MVGTRGAWWRALFSGFRAQGVRESQLLEEEPTIEKPPLELTANMLSPSLRFLGVGTVADIENLRAYLTASRTTPLQHGRHGYYFSPADSYGRHIIQPMVFVSRPEDFPAAFFGSSNLRNPATFTKPEAIFCSGRMGDHEKIFEVADAIAYWCRHFEVRLDSYRVALPSQE